MCILRSLACIGRSLLFPRWQDLSLHHRTTSHETVQEVDTEVALRSIVTLMVPYKFARISAPHRGEDDRDYLRLSRGCGCLW